MARKRRVFFCGHLCLGRLNENETKLNQCLVWRQTHPTNQPTNPTNQPFKHPNKKARKQSNQPTRQPASQPTNQAEATNQAQNVRFRAFLVLFSLPKAILPAVLGTRHENLLIWVLGVPPHFLQGSFISRKPPETRGKRQVFEKEGGLKRREPTPRHGCCWETFYIFAYCGLVVEIPSDAHVGSRGFKLLRSRDSAGPAG